MKILKWWISSVFQDQLSTGNSTSSSEIFHRIAFNKVAMKVFEKMRRCYDVSMFTALKMAQALIFSVTLNGNESWILKKWDRKGIHAFEFFC